MTPEHDPLVLAGQALQHVAESMDAQARALRQVSELLLIEAENRKPSTAERFAPRAAAREVGVSEWIIRRAIEHGELRASKYGARIVIEGADLERYRKAHRLRSVA